MTAQLADVLAWVLIHSLWQGVCVAAAALVVLRATPARYCNLRYATCMTGLFVTVLAMLVTGSALTLERQSVDGSTGVFNPAQSTTATSAATTSARSIPTETDSRERSATIGAPYNHRAG